MIIKNYGLRWHRNEIFWGWQGKKGGLFGRLSAKSEQIDFRDQIGIYVLFDSEKVVYVGQAFSTDHTLFSRIREHRTDSLADRWDRFSWFGVKKVLATGNLDSSTNETQKQIQTKAAINQAEAILISIAEPPLNKRGANWKDAQQFMQVPSKEIFDDGTDTQVLIKELHEKLCKGK